MASTAIDRRHYDAAISGLLADGSQNESELLGVNGKFPEINVGVDNFSGFAWSMPLAYLMGHAAAITGNMLQRNPNASYPRPFVDFDPTKTTYECQEESAAWSASEVEIERAVRFPIAPHVQKAQSAGSTLARRFDYNVGVNTIFATGNWPDVAVAALTGGGGVAWDVSTSTPTQDGLAMGDLIRDRCGFRPDYGYITYDVLEALRIHRETLGAYGTYAQGMVSLKDFVLDDDFVLRMYAQRWKLPGGLYCLQTMYNTAAPGQTASLADMATAQVWLGCKRGIAGGAQGTPDGPGVSLGSGPVSWFVAREKAMFGKRWRTDDPPVEHGAGGHSYAVVRPTDMADTAELLTGVVT